MKSAWHGMKLSLLVMLIVNCAVLILNVVIQYSGESSLKCKFLIEYVLNGCWSKLRVKNRRVASSVVNFPSLDTVPRRPVILMFPLSVEVDLLHVKLILLKDHVDLFWLGESMYSVRGHKKKLHFNESKFEARFDPYRNLIRHEIDTEVPGAQGRELGWKSELRARGFLGEKLIEEAKSEDFMRRMKDAVVIFTDADEVPSVEAVEWLRDNCCGKRVTYEFSSTMQHYLYGFAWKARDSGYALATARSLEDELDFRVAARDGTGYEQVLRGIGLISSGFHCGYCMSSEYCVLKLEYTNLVDGPPYLGDRKWTKEEFDMLRRCGLSPQGDVMKKHDNTLNLTVAWREYEYLEPVYGLLDETCVAVELV